MNDDEFSLPAVFVWLGSRFFGVDVGTLLNEAGLRVFEHGSGSLARALGECDDLPDLAVVPIGRLNPSMLGDVREVRGLDRYRTLRLLGITSLDRSSLDLAELRSLGFEGLIHRSARPEHVSARVKEILFEPESRRHHPRAPAFFPTEIEVSGRLETEYVLSLSVGGMRFTSARRLEKGAPLVARFRDPVSPRGFVEAPARCIYSLPGPRGGFEVGVAFLGLTPEALGFLEAEVQRLVSECRDAVPTLEVHTADPPMSDLDRARVLVIDIECHETEAIREALALASSTIQVDSLTSRGAAEKALRKGRFDLILHVARHASDVQPLPPDETEEVLATVPAPLIFLLTEETDPQREAELIEQGAADVITGPVHAKRLLARVRRHLGMRHECRRILAADGLPVQEGGASARSGAMPPLSVVAAEIERARRFGAELSLLDIAVDRPPIPASRQVGFPVACDRLEGILCSLCPESELSILAVSPEALWAVVHRSAEAALECAERLREAVAATAFRDEGQRLVLTVSIGVAGCGRDSTSQELVSKAERALREARTRGGNRSVCLP